MARPHPLAPSPSAFAVATADREGGSGGYVPLVDKYDVAPLAGFEAELGLLAAAWADGTREWRKNLGEVPDEAITWSAYEGGHSIGAVLLHMAACDTWWIDFNVLGLDVDTTDTAIAFDMKVHQYEGHWERPPAEPLSWYYEIQDRHRASVLAKIAEMKDPALEKLRDERKYTFTVRWTLAHLVEHDSYHGGQAVLLKELWERLR